MGQLLEFEQGIKGVTVTDDDKAANDTHETVASTAGPSTSSMLPCFKPSDNCWDSSSDTHQENKQGSSWLDSNSSCEVSPGCGV